MEILETSIFTKRVLELLSDDDYQLICSFLVQHPESGPIVPGSGGLRKLRWQFQGRGKRGGLRIIYYWVVSQEKILMVFIFRKNEIEDLTKDQLRTLRNLVESDFHEK